MYVYISMCVSECVDGGGDREYEVKKKNIVWIIHKGQKVTVNESVTGH